MNSFWIRSWRVFGFAPCEYMNSLLAVVWIRSIASTWIRPWPTLDFLFANVFWICSWHLRK